MEKEENKLNQGIGLLDDISENIENVEEVPIDEKTAVHRYTLKDGRIYEVPVNREIDLQAIANELVKKTEIKMPQSAVEIEKMCRDMLRRMKHFLELKEFYRYTSYNLGEDISLLEPIKNVLDYAKKVIESNASLAAKLAPVWYGHDVPGLPHYYGDNPYNIHGVDHKYDYLLKPEEQYIAKQRDLIMSIASSRHPFIPEEAVIYNASEMSNIAKSVMIEGEKNEIENDNTHESIIETPELNNGSRIEYLNNEQGELVKTFKEKQREYADIEKGLDVNEQTK